MTTDITDFARVSAVGPDLIQVEITSTDDYQALDRQIEIGSYLKISDDNGSTVVAIVRSFRIRERVTTPAEEDHEPATHFVIDCQPVGRLEDDRFRRGGKQITIPPRHIEIASSDVLRQVYAGNAGLAEFCFGALAQDPSVRVVLDGDKFFGKHIGVVGSTGSGKSCTVAKILQEGMAASAEQGSRGVLNNSHIVLFDIHGEYSDAFPEARVLDVSSLKLPYWLMNAEELEEMFIESNEENSHNQVSQFRQAVIENKAMHNAGLPSRPSYDAPVHFSLSEVFTYLSNLNNEVTSKLAGENCPKLADGTLVLDRGGHYFGGMLEFVPTSQSGKDKASNGPFHGEFNRFLMRLESRRSDQRLGFLLDPKKPDGTDYATADTTALIEDMIGYGQSKSNVTIVDLSGVPFEVLSVVVALMTRLIFTFAFHAKKTGLTVGRELPFLLVYEEAHNYVPQSDGAKYGTVRRSIERIAKEGRKYGISLMIVSQRPSEVSETVFSQCSNFVAMRLTNPADQRYVRRLLPDDLSALTDSLPSLEQREAIVIGDSVAVPSLVKIDQLHLRPNSHDIKFRTEWNKDWLTLEMQAAMDAWQR